MIQAKLTKLRPATDNPSNPALCALALFALTTLCGCLTLSLHAAGPEYLPEPQTDAHSAHIYRTLIRGPLPRNVTPTGVSIVGKPHLPARYNDPITVNITPAGGEPISVEGRYEPAKGAFDIRVEGLPPNTLCSYTVSLGAELVGPFEFMTAPQPDQPAPFRFAVIGDTQNHGVWRSLADNIDRWGPRFLVHLGDHVGIGGQEGYWDPNFFIPGRGVLARSPAISCHGNHDESNGVYLKVMGLPNYWHAAEYGNVRIVSIATFVPWQEGTEQFEWLRKELQKPWDGWLICIMHGPPFGVTPGYGLNTAWIDIVVPMMLDAGVDLLLSGHEHLYSRSKPIALRPDQRGLIQVISGGGGGKRRGAQSDLPFTVNAECVWHYLIADATPDTLRIRAVRPEGTLIDDFTLEKDAPQPDLILAPQAGRRAWHDPVPVRLAPMFVDGMVIQRDCEAPVWGWGPPDTAVRVELAGRTAETQVAEDGTWQTALQTPPAGGPHTLVVHCGETRVEVSDVLSGDVWLCSGQSNAQWPVNQALNPAQEIKDANWPQLRMFPVAARVSIPAEKDMNSRWIPCVSQQVAGASALGYFFGREIHRTQNVPVGVIVSAWGGQRIEPFISRAGFAGEGHDDILEFIDTLHEEIALSAEERNRRNAERMKAYEAEAADREFGLLKRDPGTQEGWFERDVDRRDWKEIDVPKYWDTRDLALFDGTVWMAAKVEVPAAAAGKAAVLELGPIDDLDVTWWNGVRVGATGTKTPGTFAVARRYNVPAEVITEGRNTLVVRVADTTLGGGLWGKPEQVRLVPAEGDPIPLAGTWKYRKGMPFEQGTMSPPRVLGAYGSGTPTAIHGGMIAPLVPYAIRGVIWYQGESNGGEGYAYRKLMRTLVRDWRQQWSRGVLPFLWLQLANFRASPSPAAVAGDLWPELREAQALALAEPNTAMAVTIDIGEGGNVHPRNKQEAARRLALGARALAYGEDIAYRGPVFRNIKIRRGKAVLSFDHAEGGLVAKDSEDGALRHFYVAGKDQEWHPAVAKVDGSRVVVECEPVPKPVAVRYAWLNDPAGCNLYNGEGLPAVPFRTDDWPLFSQGE